MATQILALHWKASRTVLVPFILAAFAVPLLSIQGMGGLAANSTRSSILWTNGLIGYAELWTPFFPLLSVALGCTLALTAWNWDHREKHVYALSLPIGRGEYALMKLGAGAILALIPTAALLAGSLLAVANLALPEGLHAYPFDLTSRFLLSTLTAYAVLFAVASGTVRTFVIMASTVIGFFVVGDLTLDFMANFDPAWQQVSFTAAVFDALMSSPGPLRIFTGNWMLIDV